MLLRPTNQVNRIHKSTINCMAVALKCSYCKGEHPIYLCQSFLKLPAGQRIIKVKKRNLCINCLKSNKTHQAKQCTSSSCKTCGLKHNILLHITKARKDKDYRRLRKHSISAIQRNHTSHRQSLYTT